MALLLQITTKNTRLVKTTAPKTTPSDICSALEATVAKKLTLLVVKLKCHNS